MEAELIPVKLEKIMQTRSYSVVILKTLEKRFAIYTDPQIGRVMQMYLTGAVNPRPLAHDLFSSIFKGLDIQFKQVVINDVQDTIYFARLFLEQQTGDVKQIVEIDARPSDCLALSLLNSIPIYCTKAVIDKTVEVEDDQC